MAGSVSSGTSILRTTSKLSSERLTPGRAMSSCLSVNSIPITFSALCIMSLVMRKGVGDGRGDGNGVGVWAIAFKEELDTTSPAAPAAGRSLTKDRRSSPDFFRVFGSGFFIDVLKKVVEPCLTVGLLPRNV